MSSVPTRVTSGRSSGGAARSRESGRSRTVTLPWSLPKRLRLRLRRLPLLCWLPDWLSQRPPCWLPFQSRRWPRSPPWSRSWPCCWPSDWPAWLWLVWPWPSPLWPELWVAVPYACWPPPVCWSPPAGGASARCSDCWSEDAAGAGAASVPLAWSPDGGWLVPPDGVVPPSVMLFVSFVLSPLELVPAGACAAVSGVDACSAGRPGSSPWGLPLPSPPCTVFVPAPEACAPGPSETASSAIATPAPRVRRRAPRSAPLPSGSGSPPGNGCCPGASVATVVVAEARRPRLLGADEGTNSTP